MGDEIQELVDLDATAYRILGLLDVSDTVLLLCHGVLSRQSNEMSLMVASDDSLPTQHVIAAASPSERTHQLDWQLLREMETPYVVFSAACSSGSILTEDLGEHVGIFGALRLCGTRAVVAPAWDVRANDVVPILEAVVLLYLRRGRSLIACLKEAGDQAGKHLPHWRRCLWPRHRQPDACATSQARTQSKQRTSCRW